MTHPDAPDEFELALRRREKLLPQFESDIDGPDASVDRIVLARARAPFEAPREQEPRYHRAPRWALPVALAATLLLSFTLVLQMSGRDTGTRSEGTAAMPAERADSAIASADVAPAEVATADAAVVSQAPNAEAPTAEPPVAQAPRAQAPVPAPPPPAPVAAPPAPVAASMAAPQAAADLATSAESAAMQADAAPAAAAERRATPRSDSPAAWLERIEQLRAAGDLEAARRELRAFRQQYPDVPLPGPLRGL